MTDQSVSGELLSAPPAASWPIHFLSEADALALNAGIPASGSEPVLAPLELARRLRSAANDRFSDLLIIGWVQGLFEVIAADSVLRSKRIICVVKPEHIRALMDAMGRHQQSGLNLRVAIISDRAQLPHVIQQLSHCWSLAVMDEQLCPHSELYLLGQTRFTRSRGSLQRVVGDLGHLMARLPVLGGSIPLATFKGRFRGRSALCIAAGPSLNQRMDFIRQHMHDCVVIVVDVVQARLQAAGIRIDFVLNVDSHDSIIDLLAAPVHPETVLVMPLSGHRDIDVKFPLRSHFGSGGFAHALLGGDAGFSTGTTVGIASVGFAEFLGCSDVVLAGHDLSYSETVYYSDFVADHDNHTKAMFQATRTNRRLVPGNSGEMVITDYLFDVAIQDMGLLLRSKPDLAVYNPNINDRIAAALLGTKRLPETWAPAPGERPAGPPSERLQERLTALGDPTLLMRTMLTQQIAEFMRLWKEAAGMGHDESGLHDNLAAFPPTHLAASLLSIPYFGPLMHLIRLNSLPPSIGTKHARQQAKEHLHAIQVSTAQFFMEVVSTRGRQHKPVVPDHYDASQRGFFALLSVSLGPPVDSPADSVLLPVMSRAYLYMLELFPKRALPEPQSALEGLHVMRSLDRWTPPDFVSQTLCLCALEEMAPPLDWAMKTKVLDGELIPQAQRTGKMRKLPLWVQATEAVLRLRAGTSRDPAGDGERASRWVPCHVHVIRALLTRVNDGVVIVERLLADKRIEIDDQMASLIVLHVPDYPRACHIVQPYTAVFDEACSLAIAQRQVERREFPAALRIAQGVRHLSRFKDRALTIECEIHLAQNQLTELEACLPLFSQAKLSEHWRHRLDEAVGGYAVTVARIAQEPQVVPDAAPLGNLIAKAWAARDGQAMRTIFTGLCWKGLAQGSGQEHDQLHELFVSTRTLLVHLGVDPTEIERTVAAQSAAQTASATV